MPAGLGGTSSKGWGRNRRGAPRAPPTAVLPPPPRGPRTPQGGGRPRDRPRRPATPSGFGPVTVLNGHIHQVVQKVEGKVTYQTAMSTAFPAPKAGEGPGPAPLKVPAEQLRSVIGIREVAVAPSHPLALTDITLV